MATIVSIKKELNSINKISKITNAMKIVAVSKIASAKRVFLESIELNTAIFSTAKIILSQLEKDEINNQKKRTTKYNTLWIFLSSTLGMAGSFTASMFKEFSLNFDKAHDKVIVIGEKGYKFILSNYGAGAILKHLTMSEKPDDFVYIKYLAKLVNKLYKNNEFRDVKVQYNKFKTTNQFASYTAQILPLDQKLIAPQSNAERHLTFLVEPSPMNAFLHTLDMYLQSMIYTALLETKLCEHLSRKNAMLEASANEDAKIIDLKMSYNKKRQEKITAEVSLLSLTL